VRLEILCNADPPVIKPHEIRGKGVARPFPLSVNRSRARFAARVAELVQADDLFERGPTLANLVIVGLDNIGHHIEHRIGLGASKEREGGDHQGGGLHASNSPLIGGVNSPYADAIREPATRNPKRIPL